MATSRKLVSSYLDWEGAVKDAFGAAMAKLGVTAPIVIEVPPNPDMGDLAVPCFALAKQLRKAPPMIATDLAAEIVVSAPISRIAVQGAYINFYLDRDAAAEFVLQHPESIIPKPSGRKILLEHTSANPNGPLHVGRARNPILGDTLARLHRLAGDDVHVQYYMDNLGRQVALLYWGTVNIPESSLPPAAREKIDHKLVRFYQAASDLMKENPAVKEEISKLVADLEGADPALVAKVRPSYEGCFSGMKASLNRLGATYDSIKDESDFVMDGTVERLIEKLKHVEGAAVEEDGANYLDMSEELKGNKSTKFFFTRKDQTSVYATRDIAYHTWKAAEVGEGELINVLGEDHRLQALQVRIALQKLNVKTPEVVFYAFVGLPDGKMSTRANRVVFLDDLMDEAVELAREEVRKRRPDSGEAQLEKIAEAVGIAAIRYNLARVQPEKPIQFRWEEALNFDGDSAPYLMYAYARTAGLLAKAKEAGITSSAEGTVGPGEQRLLLTLAKLPLMARQAADKHAPQFMAAYACELASGVHEYYRDHTVIGSEIPAVAQFRLRVFELAKEGLAMVLTSLGIPLLDEM